ncbi:MAG: 23S rRNA (guanosine(2251)-2'-O)-methyltransferase RlmB [Pseudomonadota bacterium]
MKPVRGRKAKGGASPHECLSGSHSVMEAMAAGRRRLHRLFVLARCRDANCRAAADLAATIGLPVESAADDVMAKMTGTSRHQGLCLLADPLPTLDLAQAMAMLETSAGDPFVLILDQISDTHNLGALLRTALCAGVMAVILAKDRSAGLTPTVSRVSAGAMEHLAVARVPNLAEAMRRLKENGIWVAGLDRDQGGDIFDTSLPGPLALVVGSEGRGMRPLLKERCDYLLAIPQHGNLNSLNASVAGGVAMYEILRRRRSVSASLPPAL